MIIIIKHIYLQTEAAIKSRQGRTNVVILRFLKTPGSNTS